MPNWVYNDLEVSGTKEDVKAFFDKAAQVNEWNATDRFHDFSFTNFVAPGPDDDYDRDWYETNVRMWGVKWDVNKSADVQLSPDGRFGTVSFESAWSVPIAAYEAIINQHPELEFEFKSIEEQGWGIELSASDPDDDGIRSLITNDEWEIPESHNEWVKRDGECRGCVWDDDPDSRYEDCPAIEVEED
jgi:hypothetical protein